MRRGLVVAAALAGICGLTDRASAQVIYYSTPYYYNSPFNPTVRTYSTPVVYSTYTSPIVVPTRFAYPPFGTVAYDNPPNAINQVPRPAGTIQPYPAFRQIGYTTYTTAPLPVGGAYYTGDAYNAPSIHRYTPYAAGPGYDRTTPPAPAAVTAMPVTNYGAFATPYFQTQFGEGYGGWGVGRGWGGWGRGWGWGW